MANPLLRRGSMKILILLLASSWSIAFAEVDVLEVLTNRSLTPEERSKIAQELTQTDNPPLGRDEAMAELCFDVDLCAQDSTDADVSEICRDEHDLDDPEKNFFADSCTVRRFRKNFSCNPNVEKLRYKTVNLILDIIRDSKYTYMSYISAPLLKILSGTTDTGVNLCESDDLNGEYEEFKKNFPEIAKAMEEMADNFPALGQYTSDCYSKMNRLLYSKDKVNLQRYFKLFAATQDALSILPDYKGKVNRGVSLPAEILEEHKIEGNKVCNVGFTSTAAHVEKDYGLKPRNSFLEGCTQRLYISQPKDAKNFGKDIDLISRARGEKEILFPPGACFRIEKVTQRIDVDFTSEDFKGCPKENLVDIEMTLIN